MKDIIRLGIFLMVVCLIAAAALTSTYLFTNPRINARHAQELQLSLKEVLPIADNFKMLNNYYTGTYHDQLLGYVLPVTVTGYGGEIQMLVGIDLGGTVHGVKVLLQQETPGLGSQAAEPHFLKQFTGKTANDPLVVKKDVQAITGATISSAAITEGVKVALNIFGEIRRK